MSEGVFSSSKKKQRRRVQIPDFLQPLVNQSAGAAGNALSNLSQFGNQDLVADFAPEQNAAFDLATARAGGAGGFIPTAQNELLSTAQGRSLTDFIPQETLSSLSGFGRSPVESSPVARLLRQLGVNTENPASEFLDDLQFGGNTTEVDIRDLLNQDLVPGAATSTLTGATAASPTGLDDIDRILEGDIIPAASRSGLESTARGDFLFGGAGFDQAVEAAQRAALPGIISTFGSAGAGGATGGLARTAVGQAATDAFARQFAQERDRQLAATGTLAELGLNETGVRLGAQNQRESQAFNRSGQGVAAAEVLANLGLSDAGLRLDAFDDLEGASLARDQLGTQGRLQAGDLLADIFGDQQNRQLQAGGLLADLFSDEQNRELQASSLLAGLAGDERDRALTATGLLPDAALLDVNLLQQVGGARQDQAQREISAPIDFNQLLLAAARSGLPIEALLGENIRGRSSGFSLSGDIPRI